MTLPEKVIVRKFAPANDGILTKADSELDTMNIENNSEIKKEGDESKLY
jgi:hypothetical protein